MKHALTSNILKDCQANFLNLFLIEKDLKNWLKAIRASVRSCARQQGFSISPATFLRHSTEDYSVFSWCWFLATDKNFNSDEKIKLSTMFKISFQGKFEFDLNLSYNDFVVSKKVLRLSIPKDWLSEEFAVKQFQLKLKKTLGEDFNNPKKQIFDVFNKSLLAFTP